MKKLDTINVCAGANGASCMVEAEHVEKSSLLSFLPQLLSHGFDALYTWQARAAQRRYLHDLEPRLLADMGITRAEAEAEASKPFWQE